MRYLIFWAPAFGVAVFYNNPGVPSRLLQAFFGFFMLFGWAVNSGMAAYDRPRGALGSILLYFGLSFLLINALYSGITARVLGSHALFVSGIFSYIPLDIFLQKILDFKIPHELYLSAAIAALCLAGWCGGILYRYHHPTPYRPKFRG